jgi:hypothetical protein
MEPEQMEPVAGEMAPVAGEMVEGMEPVGGVAGEVEEVNGEPGRLLDLSKLPKPALLKLQTTSLNHFNKFIQNHLPEAPLRKYKLTAAQTLIPEGSKYFLDPVIIGRFGTYLMEHAKVQKLTTAIAYIAALKCMMEDDFPSVSILREGRWYTRLRGNLQLMFVLQLLLCESFMIGSCGKRREREFP